MKKVPDVRSVLNRRGARGGHGGHLGSHSLKCNTVGWYNVVLGIYWYIYYLANSHLDWQLIPLQSAPEAHMELINMAVECSSTHLGQTSRAQLKPRKGISTWSRNFLKQILLASTKITCNTAVSLPLAIWCQVQQISIANTGCRLHFWKLWLSKTNLRPLKHIYTCSTTI